MTKLLNYLNNLPIIENKKDDKYYLFLGMVLQLDEGELEEVVWNTFSTGDIFKRKSIIQAMDIRVSILNEKSVDKIIKFILRRIDTLDSYFRKESASQAIVTLIPYASSGLQKEVVSYWLTSVYINNRKRAYSFLTQYWSSKYQTMVVDVWHKFDDEAVLNILVEKSTEDFLMNNCVKLSQVLAVDEDDFLYDWRKKILRNKFYVRIAKKIPEDIKLLKKTDPISYIFVMKEMGENLDPQWALTVYKDSKGSRARRYLPRWYAEMKLWDKIVLLEGADILE